MSVLACRVIRMVLLFLKSALSRPKPLARRHFHTIQSIWFIRIDASVEKVLARPALAPLPVFEKGLLSR